MTTEKLADDKLVAYTRALLDRRESGVTVKRMSEEAFSEFQPVEHRCHENANEWIAKHPGQRAVRGFFVFDFRAATLIGQRPRFEFLAHSVIEDADGHRFDVTPSAAAKDYPFIEHVGDEGAFAELIADYGVVRLRAYTDGALEITYDEASA